MGKSVHNDKVRIIATTILSVLLFIVIRHAKASHQEFELFDQGYEYYLSYQPGKAIETFNAFLKEFPDSSAKDAAMFWLGKSLMQLKSFEDAEKIFSEMKQKFPGSPFISYVNGELETINKSKSKISKTEPVLGDAVKARETELEGKEAELRTLLAKFEEQQKGLKDTDKNLKQLKEEKERLDSDVQKLRTGLDETLKVKSTLEAKLVEAGKKTQLKERDLEKATEEREKLRSLLEEKKRKIEEMEGKEVDLKSLIAKLEKQQEDWKEADRNLKLFKDELDSEVPRLKMDKKQVEIERDELRDEIKRYEEKAEAERNEAAKAKNTLEIKLAEVEKKAQLAGEDLQMALEERDRLKSLLEDEKGKTEGMRLQIARLTQQLESQVQALKADKALIENKGKELEDKVKKYEATVIKIKDKRYTAPQVLEYMITSSLVLNKLGIKEVLWRTGNFYEDFVDEHILFDEAKRLNIVEDVEKYKNLIEKYNLKKEEANYLNRYLTISNLIEKQFKELLEEQGFETLIVRYTEYDKHEKALFAAELQRDARSGKPFKDIHQLYPDAVGLRQIGFQELEGWIRERINSLRHGEISDVIWTEGAYMIFKPVVIRPQFKNLEDVQPELKDKMRVVAREWIGKLRKGVKEIWVESTY